MTKTCKNCGFEKEKHDKKGNCQIYDMSYGETIKHFNGKKFEKEENDS